MASTQRELARRISIVLVLLLAGIGAPRQAFGGEDYSPFENQVVDLGALVDLKLLLDDLATPEPDFVIPVFVILTGPMQITTFTALDDGGFSVLPWEITLMDVAGMSDLGLITSINNPDLPSTGEVHQQVPGQNFPADLSVDVFRFLDIPGYGVLHNTSPIVVEAEINAIPPLFTVMSHVTQAMLFDSFDVPRGIVVGNSITLVPSPGVLSLLALSGLVGNRHRRRSPLPTGRDLPPRVVPVLC